MKSIFCGRRLLVSAATALGVLVYAGAANAATYTVNTTQDYSGTCTASKCSLRAAVEAADNNGGGTITVPAGTYKLTIAPSGTADDPKTGDLDIDHATTINGAGSNSTIIDPNHIDRAFEVQKGASLTLAGITIRYASTTAKSAEPGGCSDACGGAIYSDGRLKVTNSILDQDVANHGGDIYVDTDAPSTSVTNSVLSHSFGGSSNGNAGGIYLDGGTLTLNHDTFDTDGGYDNAGSVYEDSGKLVKVTHTSFINGNGEYGGAIYDNDGPLTVSDSTFDNNSASEEDGGALYLAQSTGDVKITGSTFSHNSVLDDDSSHGGAIAEEAGSGVTTTISKSIFLGNAGYYGAGVYDDGGKALNITKSWFTANQSEYGGGVYLNSDAGTFTLDHSTLDHNGAAYEEGGGIYLDNASTTTISNDTISYNESGNGGGVYFETTVPAQLTNDTITHNQAGPSSGPNGGGIYSPQDASGIVNTIVADNAGGDCTQVAGSADQGYNLDSDGTCFRSSGKPEATGDKTADPLLGPLQDNGGPAPTELPQSGSPAINNGNNAACPPDDERGVPRPQPPGGKCDIGAVEVANASLVLKKSGPHKVTAGHPFTYTIKVSDPSGPGPSTDTVVVDRLPKGMKVYGVTPSQGTCQLSHHKVTCDLGAINSPNTGSNTSATITLLVTESKAGLTVNHAHASNAQGNSSSSKSKTTVSSAAAKGKAPSAETGDATNVTTHSARLHGHVDASQQTSYFFEYRTKGSSAWRATAIGHTQKARSVAVTVSHLRPGTTYEFRLVSINGVGRAYGAIHTFRTKGHISRKPTKPGRGFAG